MTVFYSDIALTKDYGDHVNPKGVVLASKATYTVPVVTPVADDTVQMNPIPKNAIILDLILGSDAASAGLTVDVGDGSTVDKFIDGQDASAAFTARMAEAGNVGVSYAAAGHIIMKFLGAAPTAAEVYICTVLYTIDN